MEQFEFNENNYKTDNDEFANDVDKNDDIEANFEHVGILDPEGINLNPLNGENYSDEYKNLAKIWTKFPAYEKAKDIIKGIDENQVILITSGTGSGKTVLVPKYVLHSFGYEKKIAITLPKQMIAQSAAEFAAKTLDVNLGQEVGYKFKGSSKKSYSDKTKMLFATDGTIVAKLMNDPTLSEFDAVLIDEAHERKVQIDFLLYLLKQVCKIRPSFKLVIMSATINEKLFAEYYGEFKFIHFDIGSKTNYPIKSIFLDNPIDPKNVIIKGIEIIKEIIKSDSKGDILFFVTSIQETLDSCIKIIGDDKEDKNYCIEVYAGMDGKKQNIAQESNSTNKRKIIVATNVAESSLTISDIKFVIDSGLELFGYYDTETKSKVLVKKLITHAQAKQRMGRTGRTSEGVCYHLYTKNDFDNLMDRFPLPTIKSSNIYGECLKLLSLESIQTTDKLQNILSKFIEPPSEKYAKDSITTLMRLGLIENGTITDLGKRIADLQVDPMQGLSIYYAFQLGCVREVISIFCMIDAMKGNISELFQMPKSIVDLDDKDKFNHINKKFLNAKNKLADSSGDHITLLKIFLKYTKLRKNNNETKLNDWLYENFLKKSVLEKAHKYYIKVKNSSMSKLTNNLSINWNEHTQKVRILTSILCGFFLNTVHIKNNNDQKKNIKISLDSFLDKQQESSEMLYNELTTISGNISMSICSKISKSVRTLYTEIPV